MVRAKKSMRTPSLDTPAKKKDYIANHLFNELRWTLAAATEWSIQERLQLDINGYHMQLYAMDSAFLHARTLFEFFLKRTGDNYYGYDQFFKTVLKSDRYGNRESGWSGPLHRFLMHAQDRSSPKKLDSPDGPKDLNQMPVYFAQEVLRLWKKFEEALRNCGNVQDRELQKLARDKRREAIEGAQCVVNSIVTKQHAGERHESLKPVFVFTD